MKTYKMKINGNEYEVAVKNVEGINVEVEVNGKTYSVELEQAAKPAAPVVTRPVVVPTAGPTLVAPSTKPATTAVGATNSPLPGTVLSINIVVGQVVKAADVAIVLEAMKMENNINCGKDGVVKAIYVQKGDNVLEGASLFLIE
ncbi:MAG: acetyl-CoA carboxylase biotin carboxyl carrier protein subunit [Bacteroidales bacterium]|nr:acetyl-CoA carboxylase biotin carboxyl carrier protein subunit [Bacteroidales bacterium]